MATRVICDVLACQVRQVIYREKTMSGVVGILCQREQNKLLCPVSDG
jgi:hypothetical protein